MFQTAYAWNRGIYARPTSLENTEEAVPYAGSQVRVLSSQPRSMYDASGFYVDLPMDAHEFHSTLEHLRKTNG